MAASPETKGPDFPGPWAKTYQATTKDELLRGLRRMECNPYDVDSIQRFGYLGPQRAAEELVKYLKKAETTTENNEHHSPAICDVGAGTGLVGAELHARLNGNCHITALDYSPDMLEIAQQKGCYAQGQCVDLLQTEEPKDDNEQHNQDDDDGTVFDAVISVGTLTPNHLGAETLDRVVQMVKPRGGILCV